MKHLIKSVTEPTTLYVLGCNFENLKPNLIVEEGNKEPIDLLHKDEDYEGENPNLTIMTRGTLHLLTQEELDKNLSDIDKCGWSLSREGVKIENFSGDIYVDIVTEDGDSVSPETVDLTENIYDSYPEDYHWEDDLYLHVLFPEGSLDGLEQEEVGNLLEIEGYEGYYR